ncbi:hypothetical protein HK100_005491 [Physocladia obscura]|uniref:Methyltransferase domain-containing protein n=1 Tax=Physocladia obscura TaxID=109957 RepID=A0AAD5T5X5_9FUNG|nr:hypothetical protein HK100_005491 [Physocladia obscura]
MGPYLSKVIKKKLADDPLSPTHASQDYDSTQEKLDSPNGNAASGSIPQSPKSQTGSSKKYELKPAHVNTSVAKTWNPNDPKSWEPEMREYHSLPTSDYMLPNDATEQDRLEMQHYIYRAAFGGDIVCPIVNDLIKLPGYKILDVGCAKGFWLKQLQKISPDAEYHGVDISKTLVEQFAEEGVSLKFGNVLETLPCKIFH